MHHKKKYSQTTVRGKRRYLLISAALVDETRRRPGLNGLFILMSLMTGVWGSLLVREAHSAGVPITDAPVLETPALRPLP